MIDSESVQIVVRQSAKIPRLDKTSPVVDCRPLVHQVFQVVQLFSKVDDGIRHSYQRAFRQGVERRYPPCHGVPVVVDRVAQVVKEVMPRALAEDVLDLKSEDAPHQLPVDHMPTPKSTPAPAPVHVVKDVSPIPPPDQLQKDVMQIPFQVSFFPCSFDKFTTNCLLLFCNTVV